MRSMTVAQLCNSPRLRALVLHKDSSLQEVINSLANDEALFGIFLVDSDERLVATLNHRQLLCWMRLQSGSSLWLESFFTVGQLRQLVCAERVWQLAVPEVGQTAVTLTDTLSDVVQKMVKQQLTIAPVVDDNGRLVSDLLWHEVLFFMMRTTHSSQIR